MAISAKPNSQISSTAIFGGTVAVGETGAKTSLKTMGGGGGALQSITFN